MSAFEVREEVLNVELARLLENRGLITIPETIRRATASRTRRLPDVTIADLWGITIVIEGRLSNGRPVRDSLITDARARIEEGISRICLAVLYPRSLRRVETMPNLRRALARETLSVSVITEGRDGDWEETTVDGIAAIVRRGIDLLVSEDVVIAAVGELTGAIDGASESIAAAPAAGARLRHLLGIPEDRTDDDAGEE